MREIERRGVRMKACKVAVVQWARSVHDSRLGAERAVTAIGEAAGKGASLVVFPEVWLQGYPYWAGIGVQEPEFHAFRQKYFESGVAVPGPELDQIREAAARHKSVVVMSLTERAGGTLYCTAVYIGADGRLLGRHRKLMPTLTERLVWGMGDGSDLEAYDTDLGRVSGLLCFEHHMSPARYALGSLGVELHAAMWPGYPWLNRSVDACTRQLAFENGCYVLVAREVMNPDRLAPGMPEPIKSASSFMQTGGSAIIAPNGEYVVEPVFDQEQILVAELDPSVVGLQKWFFDGAGHYTRPDVFQMLWHRQPKPAVISQPSQDDGEVSGSGG